MESIDGYKIIDGFSLSLNTFLNSFSFLSKNSFISKTKVTKIGKLFFSFVSEHCATFWSKNPMWPLLIKGVNDDRAGIRFAYKLFTDLFHFHKFIILKPVYICMGTDHHFLISLNEMNYFVYREILIWNITFVLYIIQTYFNKIKIIKFILF